MRDFLPDLFPKAMARKQVDYSLYLVTDSSLVPAGSTLLTQVEKAIQGGTTIVQLREKNLDTGAFVSLALQIKQLTQKYNVPLIINDRIDVAMAIDADGVHIGQDDMPLSHARAMLGHNKIIGVSVNTIQEAGAAISGGADYLGIGAVWDTATKKLTKATLGISGVKGSITLFPTPGNLVVVIPFFLFFYRYLAVHQRQACPNRSHWRRQAGEQQRSLGRLR